jgi:hypothetical protein
MSTAQKLEPVIARRVESDFPAEWCFVAELEVEHDAADVSCNCSDCFEQRRVSIQARCGRIEATLDVFAIDELVRQDNESWAVLFFRAQLLRSSEVANSNAETDRSRAPTWPAPRMSVLELAASEAE